MTDIIDLVENDNSCHCRPGFLRPPQELSSIEERDFDAYSKFKADSPAMEYGRSPAYPGHHQNPPLLAAPGETFCLANPRPLRR